MKATLNALLDELNRDRSATAESLVLAVLDRADAIQKMLGLYALQPVKYRNGHITMDEMLEECDTLFHELTCTLKNDTTFQALKEKYDTLDEENTKLKKFINTLK